MAARTLARRMGSFFTARPRVLLVEVPPEYKIRYRGAAGKQTEESGFGSQDKAIARLMEAYNQNKAAPRSPQDHSTNWVPLVAAAL
ncbi:hypothetical protein [Streptomyces sp. NRRL S-1022]|uniref:hypothetical protein n=1 Tax=Streptomyces sp. NRRL S-1022 TaxID=1463880 RepID=UPI0004C23D04|nr:hypothetical protein [Streptomyces sp. NRRL S-1022]